MTHGNEKDRRPLYVLPDRWDHAMSVANRFARRDGTRYEVRWFRPRQVWIVRETCPAESAEEQPR